MAHKYYSGDKSQAPRADYQDSKKYIPSLEVGEYEQYKKKQIKKGGLYPLGEEGQYGPPPSALPPPLPGYKKRERKPKVYASYAVSHDCEAHGEKLSRQMVPARRASSYTRSSPSPTPAPARQRSNSFRQASPSVQHEDYHGRADWKGSLRSTHSPARSYRASSNSRKTSRCSQHRESLSPSRTMSGSPEPPPSPKQQQVKRPERRSVPSEVTDWGYTSYNNFTNTRGTVALNNRSASYSKYSSQARDSSFDESYEDFGQNYSYNNNNSYSSSKTKSPGVTGGVGLASLKTPEINPWDNMGILGLSSKMFSDSSSAKQSVYSSSSLIRRESVSSHVM